MKPFREGIAPIHGKFTKPGQFALHGDVVIERVTSVPEGFTEMAKDETGTIAVGEATLHSHRLFGGEFQIRIDRKQPSVRHLRVVKETVLKHQEHLPITLSPGDYTTRIQVEYDPFEKLIRRVA